MYKTNFLFFLFAVFLFSTLSFSQNIVQKTDTIGYYKLSEVVISATKTNANTLQLASSISVIDAKQISNSNSNNVFDVLRNETGISFTRQGGNGTLSNIYIRGSNSSHTLVLIDGVEVNLTNDPSGVYDFSALPVDNIERIEVLRGPQSTLYGSDALAGVINIITKKGNGAPKFSLLTEGGTYNTYKGMIGLNGSINKLNYSLALSRSGSEGFSAASEKYGNTEKDGYTFNNLTSVLGYDLSDNAEINLYTRFLKSESDNDQFGGMFGDDPTYLTKQEEFSIRGEGKIKLLNGNWNQKLGLTFIRNVRKNSFDTSSASAYYSNALYDGRRYKIDWQNDFQLSKGNLLTAGIEFEKEESSSEYYSFNYILLPDYASVIPNKDANTISAFLQDQIKLEEGFFITLGLRLDKHSKFGSQFTYRIAPAYMLWETGTKIKATIGTGFKAPSLYYLYDPAYGNENLNPEESFGWDFGIEQFFFKQNLSFGITFFYNKFSDMFGFDYQTFKTINIKQAVTKGLEFYFQTKPIDDLEIKANYTFTDARDVSPNSSDFDTKLLRRPESKVGFFTSYSFSAKTNLNAEIIWVGTRDDIDFSTYQRTELKGYVLLNLAAHYNLFDFLRLNARVENLLDTDYEEVFGYATPGLSFYGGIKFSL
ncbi:MAG TPA: TonB-dependent receptor [Ignavibacteriaceae bacterium]|nr:TonB-dependent receptor [Ignavibacterium sp.]HRP93451.1 TonB-dependent receptor [Ignavibacteriaceae bacterium]